MASNLDWSQCPVVESIPRPICVLRGGENSQPNTSNEKPGVYVSWEKAED